MTTENRINEALKYLKSIDIKALEVGKHIINDWLYINVEEYISKPISNCRFESHKKYVDIQMMIHGIEAIETCDTDKLEAETDYSEEKDIAFWKKKPGQMRSVITDNAYVILYPHNAHMPCIAEAEPAKVRKLVAKVLIEK